MVGSDDGVMEMNALIMEPRRYALASSLWCQRNSQTMLLAYRLRLIRSLRRYG